MSEFTIKQEELPKTWMLTTLGVVVDYGGTYRAEPTDIANSDWVLELEDIEKDTSRLLSRVNFSQRPSKSTKNRFKAGDVLYGKLRPYLNKVLIADRDGYCTTEIIPIRPSALIDNRYLFYWLKHPMFLHYVVSESHGLNMPRLGTATAKAAPFVLAPAIEQRRIADELDVITAKFQSCSQRLKGIPALLKKFRQSVLDAATSGKLTNDWGAENKSSWVPIQLSEVVKQFSYGSSAKSAKAGLVPVLRMGNIQGGRLEWSSLVYSSDPKEIERYKLTKGDVLFNRTNSPELVGKTAVYQGEMPAIYAGYLIRVSCSSRLLPEYLSYCLNSSLGREYCWNVKSDGVNQSNINAKKLAAFQFLLPVVDEQVEIVKRAEQLLALADNIESHWKRASAEADRFLSLVLYRAFCGELVPQDSDDEPASELLLKILEEKEASKSTKKLKPKPHSRILRHPKETAAMTKTRQDDDVKGKPYLTECLMRLGKSATAEALFKIAELSISDFYKQLSWEVSEGFLQDKKSTLELGDAT